MKYLVLAFVLCLAVALFLVSGPADTGDARPSARAIEATLLAPCCFNGTLDTHDSPLAHDLRDEIEKRVAGGKSTGAVEADLVGRYGPRIRALPNPRVFTIGIATVLAGVGLAGLALLVRVRAWRRPRQVGGREAKTDAATPEPPRDAYDDRLDHELANTE